jgi:hypothetical protein
MYFVIHTGILIDTTAKLIMQKWTEVIKTIVHYILLFIFCLELLAKNNPKLHERPKGGRSFQRIDSL